MLVVTYDQDDVVELVEVGYGVHDQVFFDGVQLTYRFMDEVMADLAAKGHRGTPSDIGFDLQAGFAIFSMESLSAQELDPDASEDDPRRIVEGVAIAPYSYFTDDQPPLNGTAEKLEGWYNPSRPCHPQWSSQRSSPLWAAGRVLAQPPRSG